MKFINHWTLRPGSKLSDAVDRFILTGDPKPEGVTSLGRWFRTDLQGGYHLIEATDASAIARYCARWADLLDIQTSAVIEDVEALSVLGEVPGVSAKIGAAAGAP